MATIRGQRDLAIGNVVGSNVFNLLGILGVATLVTPGGLAVPDAILAFDAWVMLAVAVVCLPIFVSGYGIARWEGAVLLAGYVAYTATLVGLASTGALAPDPAALAWALGVPTAVLLALGLGPSIGAPPAPRLTSARGVPPWGRCPLGTTPTPSPSSAIARPTTA